MLKHVVIIALALATSAALAQEKARPKNLQPVDEDLLKPPQVKEDPSTEPKVTIKESGKARVEEVRVGGKLKAIRVFPEKGRPYVLVNPDVQGAGERVESPSPGLSVPMWLIYEF